MTKLQVEVSYQTVPTTVEFTVQGRNTAELHNAAAQALLKLVAEGEAVQYHMHLTPVMPTADGQFPLWEARVEALLVTDEDRVREIHLPDLVQ